MSVRGVFAAAEQPCSSSNPGQAGQPVRALAPRMYIHTCARITVRKRVQDCTADRERPDARVQTTAFGSRTWSPCESWVRFVPAAAGLQIGTWKLTTDDRNERVVLCFTFTSHFAVHMADTYDSVPFPRQKTGLCGASCVSERG